MPENRTANNECAPMLPKRCTFTHPNDDIETNQIIFNTKKKAVILICLNKSGRDCQ